MSELHPSRAALARTAYALLTADVTTGDWPTGRVALDILAAIDNAEDATAELVHRVRTGRHVATAFREHDALMISIEAWWLGGDLGRFSREQVRQLLGEHIATSIAKMRSDMVTASCAA